MKRIICFLAGLCRGNCLVRTDEFVGLVLFITCFLDSQDIMSKIKNWIVDEKKHVRFYHDWNDKEVFIFKLLLFAISVKIGPVFI